MSPGLFDTLRIVAETFEKLDRKWALIGGLAISGIEPELVASAMDLEILPGLIVPVARQAHLVALKALAVDPDLRPRMSLTSKPWVPLSTRMNVRRHFGPSTLSPGAAIIVTATSEPSSSNFSEGNCHG